MDLLSIEKSVSFDQEIRGHKIMSMEEEKRVRLFTAAMEEFRKGYGKANTDAITRNAGISKGLLFHYFGSKKGLFLFLMRYAIEIVNAEYAKAVVPGGDFIETIWKISLTAVKLNTRMPLILWFMGIGALDMAKENLKTLKDFGSPLERLLRQAGEQADRSLFREDADIPKAVDIMIWTVQGYNARIARYDWRSNNFEPYIEQIERDLRDYLDLFRKLFYKP